MQLGYIDVDKMLQEISADKFVEWMAFYELDPWGDQRADLRAAEHMAIVVNMNIPKGKKKVTIRDFMHYAEQPDPKPMSQEESIRYIQDSIRGRSRKTH